MSTTPAVSTVLTATIDDDQKKRTTLRRDSFVRKSLDEGDMFGAKAPIMVPDKSVTMCQTCSAPFTFTFRRHHCRACGKVVCGNCSQWKAYLPYMQKTERVCEDCHQVSQGAAGSGVEATDNPPSPKTSKKQEGVLDLKAFGEDTVVAGYVNWQEGKKWTKMWYQIKTDHVLYKFRAHEDIKAVNSMPLPGYKIVSDKGSSTINLIHASGKKQLCDTFKVDTPDEFDYWVEVLEKASKMELTDLLSPASGSSIASGGWKRRSTSMATTPTASPEHKPRPQSLDGNSLSTFERSM